MADSGVENEIKSEWILDFARINPMCVDKEIFTNLNTFVKSTLKLGNNSELSVFGKERIDISIKDGSSNFIYYVLYVQNLHHNSLSIGRLSLKCYNTVFDDKVCTVSDPKRGLIQI